MFSFEIFLEKRGKKSAFRPMQTFSWKFSLGLKFSGQKLEMIFFSSVK